MYKSATFVSYLATDDFLPGVLVLHESLRKYHADAPFLLLVSHHVSSETLDLLDRFYIKVKQVDPIHNPQKIEHDIRRFSLTYTKLRLFDLTEYKKIVYLDADMVVCGDIESLFDQPHMAAVNAGGLLPRNYDWIDLNSGLMVIEPDHKLFQKMMHAVGMLSSKDSSDQGFLHSFFPDWSSQPALHLDHAFNVPAAFIDEYCDQFNYTLFSENKISEKQIRIIHYWGPYKPWEYDISIYGGEKFRLAVDIWWQHYETALERLDKGIIHMKLHRSRQYNKL